MPEAAACLFLSLSESLLAVELDDELFLDRHREVFAPRKRFHYPTEVLRVNVQPPGDTAPHHGLERLADPSDLAAPLAERHGVALAHGVRRDAHFLPVDEE